MRLVYITTKDKEQAEQIGRELVTRKLAACVNILPAMTSVYRWEGRIETSEEAVLIAKTGEALVERLIEAVKELHTYSVPCALVLPTLGGNPDYLAWLEGEIR